MKKNALWMYYTADQRTRVEMAGRHPPPPTKFGPKLPAQAKRDAGHPTQPIAPPATRFGAKTVVPPPGRHARPVPAVHPLIQRKEAPRATASPLTPPTPPPTRFAMAGPPHRITHNGPLAAGPFRTIQRAAIDWQDNSWGYSLRDISKTVFDKGKARSADLMEVQSSYIGDKLYIAGNYSFAAGGNGVLVDNGRLDDLLPKNAKNNNTGFTVYRDSTRHETFSHGNANTAILAGNLHAEQSLLLQIAKRLKAGDCAQSTFTIIGTKRPCSICHRVLKAFNAALKAHYPGKTLKFVNKTGKDTRGGSVGNISDVLPGMKNNSGTTFDSFVDAFTTAYGALGGLAAYDTLGEDNGTRTNASTSSGELTDDG